MKSKIAAFAGLALCGSVFGFASQAFAVVMPGWERPVSQADMAIVRAVGGYESAKTAKLVLTRSSEQDAITGAVLLLDGQPIYLTVHGRSVDECGSVAYTATPLASATPTIERAILHLTDHTGRQCKDLQSKTWEAELESDRGQLELTGRPEAILIMQ